MSAPVLPPVSPRTRFRDEAVKTLQAAIIAGELRPGAVYSAPTLAAQLGMSATPVREAMLDLVKDGLVEIVRNKGFRVVEIDEAELDDLTEVRLLLEVPAVRRLAKRGLADDEYARLRALAAAIESAARTGDVVGQNRADYEFHSALLGLLGNTALLGTVQGLRTRSRLYGMASLPAGVLRATHREHAELLDLIRARDARGAAALMTTHISHVRGEWAGR